MPFGQHGGAALPQRVSRYEVTFAVEVIEDRGMDGGKSPESLYVPEFRHRSLRSSERKVGIFGSVI